VCCAHPNRAVSIAQTFSEGCIEGRSRRLRIKQVLMLMSQAQSVMLKLKGDVGLPPKKRLHFASLALSL
jgi:hypothetical protein